MPHVRQRTNGMSVVTRMVSWVCVSSILLACVGNMSHRKAERRHGLFFFERDASLSTYTYTWHFLLHLFYLVFFIRFDGSGVLPSRPSPAICKRPVCDNFDASHFQFRPSNFFFKPKFALFIGAKLRPSESIFLAIYEYHTRG